MATRLDFALTRADDLQLDLTYTADGDISGSAIVMTVRDWSTDAVVFTRANVAGGGGAAQATITNGPLGQFSVYIVPANTSGLSMTTAEFLKLRHDIELTTAAGEVRTIFDGVITVKGDATR